MKLNGEKNPEHMELHGSRMSWCKTANPTELFGVEWSDDCISVLSETAKE